MTSDHFDFVLDELLSRRPFQIFTVRLHDGHVFEIDHLEALSFSEGLAVFTVPGGIQIWIDHDSVSQVIEATRELCPR